METRTMRHAFRTGHALWHAIWLTFAGSAFAADNKTLGRAGHLHSYEIFLKICVSPQPDIKAVNAALKSAQVKAMPAEGARMGGSVLGLEQTLELLNITEQRYQGGIAISKDHPKANGQFVGASVIIGTARAQALKRDITICSVGVQNGVVDRMKTLVVDLLQREPDYTSTSKLPDGDKTDWLNWNTTGSKKGVLLLGIASPAGFGNPDKLIHHFVAIGLQPK